MSEKRKAAKADRPRSIDISDALEKSLSPIARAAGEAHALLEAKAPAIWKDAPSDISDPSYPHEAFRYFFSIVHEAATPLRELPATNEQADEHMRFMLFHMFHLGQMAEWKRGCSATVESEDLRDLHERCEKTGLTMCLDEEDKAAWAVWDHLKGALFGYGGRYPAAYVADLVTSAVCGVLMGVTASCSDVMRSVDLDDLKEQRRVLALEEADRAGAKDASWSTMESRALKHRVDIDGHVGWVYEYPNGKAWARIENPDKKLGSFPNADAAREAVLAALKERP